MTATAVYALDDVARLCEGEWVLIHSAVPLTPAPGGRGRPPLDRMDLRGIASQTLFRT